MVITIWDTSIWRLACWNPWKIRSAQKCYLCLRYVVSPMSPGRTPFDVGGADGIRTHDLLDAIEARSQLRHGPTGALHKAMLTSARRMRLYVGLARVHWGCH